MWFQSFNRLCDVLPEFRGCTSDICRFVPIPYSLRVKSFSPEVTMRSCHFARFVVCALLLLSGLNAFAANTYYIDYSSGRYTNNGTAKTTPWQHLPGMAKCASGAACKYNPVAGDQ